MIEAGRRSLRFKLMFVVLATTLCALLIAGAAMMLYDLKSFRQAALNNLNVQANILGRASAAALAFDDPGSAQAYLALLKAKPEISAAAIYTESGALFATYLNAPMTREQLPAPKSERYEIQGKRMLVFQPIVESGEALGTVYLEAHFDPSAWLGNYFAVLGGIMALSMLVALLLSAWLQAVVMKPILSVSEVARRVMQERDFSLRATKTTDDEVGYLVDAFNGMLAEVGQRAQELRELNAALEQRVADRTAELEAANKELEAFSYSASHDLRAPLRSISGFITLLREDHGEHLDAEANRKLDVVLDAAHRMGQLIDDLLAFSRMGRQAIKWTPLDMTKIARNAYDGLEGAKKEVDFRLQTLPSSMGDPTLLEHVWINYLSNALKFSAKKSGPQIEVGAEERNNEWIYFVRDNGAGFDASQAHKLFGVFERLHSTREFEGTGVGLALVHRIVTRHGGRVWAEGQPDVGATFYFSLPKTPKS